jgi:hypothetical protein
MQSSAMNAKIQLTGKTEPLQSNLGLGIDFYSAKTDGDAKTEGKPTRLSMRARVLG